MMSKDVVSVSSLVGSVLMLRIIFVSAAGQIAAFIRYCLNMAQEGEPVSTKLLMQGVFGVCKRCGTVVCRNDLADADCNHGADAAAGGV